MALHSRLRSRILIQKPIPTIEAEEEAVIYSEGDNFEFTEYNGRWPRDTEWNVSLVNG